MAKELQKLLGTVRLPPAEIAAKTREIYEAVLGESEYLACGNFERIHTRDLRLFFDQYDRVFFRGQCLEMVGEDHLFFRLSNRMTSAGGKTTRRVPHRRFGGSRRPEYEIAVSTTLLFQAFGDVDRPITVAGIVCRDRLEALQRVFEHELVHLIEWLIWHNSSCTKVRFQNIAANFFAHNEHTHRLITPRERAFKKYGIRAGDRVSFRFDGMHYTGIVNRITKRATVLVEDPQGERFSDGKRYQRFYVPVPLLEKEETGEGNTDDR
jgi:hypothetical protein